LKAFRAPDVEFSGCSGLSMPWLTRVIGHNISLNAVSFPVSCVLLTHLCEDREEWNGRDVVESKEHRAGFTRKWRVSRSPANSPSRLLLEGSLVHVRIHHLQGR
jgi:hypothetical protein